MKVLIVDDRADNRLLLREQLHPLTADTVAADSGVRALRELRAQAFDLVITDLLMPEMDGFQLCYLLKTDTALKRTPVVIYTANYATKRDEDQAKNLGADDFITRPIDDDQLTARIDAVMQRARDGRIAEPSAQPSESGGFFREYSTLLIEKLEDQLITAEQNAALLKQTAELRFAIERSNAELKGANRDLEEYTYSVSHDLRAPVRAIEGMARALAEELGSALTPDTRRLLDRIQFNVTLMHALIDGLLAHARIRGLDRHLDRVELRTAVTAALAGLDFQISETNAAIDVSPALPAVLAHQESLVQVITNLVSNALKFVRPGTAPKIAIRAHAAAGRVQFSVRDHGIGVPAAFHDRLVKIFERVPTAHPYAGTGIGLAIVQKGIERMGGTVGVESVENQGTTFWFELAAADPAPAPG